MQNCGLGTLRKVATLEIGDAMEGSGGGGWNVLEGRLTLRLLMSYTGCPRRNVKYFGRVFLMLNYTDITQNTYIQS